MTALIRSELLALRSLRTSYALPVTLLGLVALITIAAMGDAGTPGTTTPDELREPFVVSAGILGAILLAVFAVIRVGGEYRYETISQRFLAASRSRVLVAKLLTYATLAVLLGAAAVGLGLALTEASIASKDLTLDYSGAELAQLFASALLGTALFAMLGVAFSFICRSQSAALLIVLGLFPAEKILGLLVGDAAAFMPYGALQSALDQGATAPATAAAVLAATTAAVTIAAWVLLRRRDVT